jgi:hypothetical protein
MLRPPSVKTTCKSFSGQGQYAFSRDGTPCALGLPQVTLEELSSAAQGEIHARTVGSTGDVRGALQ